MNYEIKMSKTDVNKLLYEISKDDLKYSLILKMVYVYGKNISDVLNLKKGDIDLNRNIIRFNLSKSYLTVPIVPDISTILVNYINGLNGDGYLFLDDDTGYDTNTVTKRINYYLHNKIKDLNKNSDSRLSVITTRDLKRLRGQHLYFDNVPVESIHELYNNFNLNESKNLIKYDEIKEANHYSEVGDMLLHYTDLNVYREENYDDDDLFVVINNDGDCGVVEFNDDGLAIVKESGFTDELMAGDVDELYGMVKGLNHGEFKFVNGLKFLK